MMNQRSLPAGNRLTYQIAQARALFAGGGALPAGVVSEPLQRSWERTRAAGLRPSDHALFHHQVTEQRRKRVHDEHRPLIEFATQDMDHLLRAMNSPNWVVLLTNSQGTIVHALGDCTLAPRRLRLPLGCGRSLMEGEIGSNAPIIAGQEAQDILLFGHDHYLDELRTFTCAAAPVFGVDGQVAAVLDVTGVDVQADTRTLNRVRRVARSIEGRMWEAHADGMLIRLHEDPRFIGTPEQGILLLAEDGRLLGASVLARRMLSLPAQLATPDLPSIDALFDCRSMSGLMQHATTDPALAMDRRYACALQTHAGELLYATLQLQRPTPRGLAVSTNRPVSSPPQRRLEFAEAGSAVQSDPSWRSAYDQASLVYPHGLAVLIQGETGTGKEWFARSLHQTHRPHRPFVAINCAALAESMAEAELFGYVEGAFTGARRGGAAGRLEQADGGTLFLDEIGDMPMHLQSRLLRVLQERAVLRLGGSRETPLDVLVLSASNRDLNVMVAAGSFRQDLFYRLNGLTVRVPALRDRKDIDELIDRVMEDRSVVLPDELRARLRAYAWPGNLRQLVQVLRVASLLARGGGTILPEMLAPDILASSVEPPTTSHSGDAEVPTSMPAIQRSAATQMLATHGGNVTAAAKALGVSRTTLYRYLRETR